MLVKLIELMKYKFLRDNDSIMIVDLGDTLIYKGRVMKHISQYPLDKELLNAYVSHIYPYQDTLVIVIIGEF